ncbi:unnamed protein product [Heterobilharzia americana]|nr:unnamed protein product [Heterobilharzia americana]
MNTDRACAACQETVYPFEVIRCFDQIWHRKCFRCQHCGMALSICNYHGFDKKPYCAAHSPKPTSFTLVTDTPELLRVANNTRMFSSIRYSADAQRIRGKITSFPDDLWTQHTLKLSKQYSEANNIRSGRSSGFDERYSPQSFRQGEVRTGSAPYNNHYGSSVTPPPNRFGINNHCTSPHTFPSSAGIRSRSLSNHNGCHLEVDPLHHHHHYDQVISSPPSQNGLSRSGSCHSIVINSTGIRSRSLSNHNGCHLEVDPLHHHHHYDQVISSPPSQNGLSRSGSCHSIVINSTGIRSRSLSNHNGCHLEVDPLHHHHHYDQVISSPPSQNGLSRSGSCHSIVINSTGIRSRSLSNHNGCHLEVDPLHHHHHYDQVISSPPSQNGLSRSGSCHSIVINSTAFPPANNNTGNAVMNNNGNVGSSETINIPRGSTLNLNFHNHSSQTRDGPNNSGFGGTFIAQYSYEAKDDDEVTFKPGDVIVNGQPISEGWMYGTVQRTGQFGMLPSNYVKLHR